MGTGQKSSDNEVSEFGTLSKKEVISESKNVSLLYLLIEECLYSMSGTIICLITVPNVKESEEFGDNFHNRHGSYLSWTCVP